MGYRQDLELLPLALRENGQYHAATDWYLRGWVPLPYQYAIHHILLPNVTWLAGIASGKTRGSAASCLIDSLSIPYFKILNTSVTARQAELGFDMFTEWYEGNKHLEHLIEDIRLRPWPIITFKNYSVWEFRTAGTDARFIRGTEYDRIVFDEAGLDYAGSIVKVLRGRLRGVRPNGIPRMARMDVITSPTDAPWLRERWEWGDKRSGKYKRGEYTSVRVRTRENTRLTEMQVRAMESEYTDEMIAVEMDAEFPDYGMSMFPRSHIIACTDSSINDVVYISLNPEDKTPIRKGYSVEEHPRYGVTKMELPYDPRAMYIIAGDPGQSDPPGRSAGPVGVLDVTKKPARLVYFDWVAGHGSYMPFLNSYKYAIRKYHPMIKLLDTTGPQKALNELAFEQLGIETDGFNFSRDKDAALNSLSLAVTNHDMSWPLVKGLVKQMSTYTREADKKHDFPQDIVMMLAMLAFGMRYAPEEPLVDIQEKPAVSRPWRRVRTTTARMR